MRSSAVDEDSGAASFAGQHESYLNLASLDIPHDRVDEATHMDLDEWEKEIESLGEFFENIGPSMPRAMKLHRELVLARIEAVKGGHG